MKINQIIRERSQQDDCPPCPTAPPAKQRDGMINHPLVDKALTPHWLTNLIPGVNVTQTVAKAARDLVNAINDEDPKAMASAVASVPGPLGTAGRTAKVAMGAYDTVKKDGPSVISKIQSYNPFRSRSGPPAPIEYRKTKLAATMEELNRIKKLALIEAEQAPPMPDIQGITPGQVKDLGDGSRVTVNQDGTVSYSGAWGTYIYNAQGQHVKTKSPSFAGYSQETGTDGKVTQQNYDQGPMSIQTGPQGTTANYQLGADNLQVQNPAVKESLELTDMLRIAGLR